MDELQGALSPAQVLLCLIPRHRRCSTLYCLQHQKLLHQQASLSLGGLFPSARRFSSPGAQAVGRKHAEIVFVSLSPLVKGLLQGVMPARRRWTIN